MRVFLRFLIALLAVVGTLTMAMVAVGVLVVAAFTEHGGEKLPDRMVLTLDLDRGVSEGLPDSPFGAFASRRRYTVGEIVESLELAANDPRVTALSVSFGEGSLGMAQAEQVRRAVGGFGRSGKPTYLFSDSLGGTIACFVASAFDEIWLQPSGSVDFKGFMTESPFLKTALDDLGIRAEFSSRHEYKMAPEMFTATAFSEQSKESLGMLLESWTGQVVSSIAKRRNLPSDKVRALMDRAPLLASEALEAGLVDKLGYADQLRDAIAAKAGTSDRVDVRTYHARKPPVEQARKVAIIHGVGPVQRGDGRLAPLASAVMSSDTVAKAFADAVADKDVAAILFRVDSPGGDYVAADTIWHEVRRAREKGKPVVVSMGNLAASGGYFVSMAADSIVAEPGTITGSIGVFSGKFVLRQFWDKIGISWDEVHVGANAPMWSLNSEFTPEQRRRFDKVLDVIYADFTTKAAAARGLTAEEIDRAARGRIFSGADAAQLGLVDELGGIDTAVEVIRKKASIPAEAPIELVPFPTPKDVGTKVLEALLNGELTLAGGDFENRAALGRLIGALSPLLRHIEAAKPGADALRMPPVDFR